MNEKVINYRFVINDAMCRDWEELSGTTLTDLVQYLKVCENTCDLLGEPWDYRRLSYGGTFDPHIVSYGARSQFWLPVIPGADEFTWNGPETLTVECCGQTLTVKEEWDRVAVCPDIGYMLHCAKCGRHSLKFNGKLHKSAAAAKKHWDKIFGRIV